VEEWFMLNKCYKLHDLKIVMRWWSDFRIWRQLQVVLGPPAQSHGDIRLLLTLLTIIRLCYTLLKDTYKCPWPPSWVLCEGLQFLHVRSKTPHEPNKLNRLEGTISVALQRNVSAHFLLRKKKKKKKSLFYTGWPRRLFELQLLLKIAA
jgi:hypothetical protein